MKNKHHKKRQAERDFRRHRAEHEASLAPDVGMMFGNRVEGFKYIHPSEVPPIRLCGGCGELTTRTLCDRCANHIVTAPPRKKLTGLEKYTLAMTHGAVPNGNGYSLLFMSITHYRAFIAAVEAKERTLNGE